MDATKANALWEQGEVQTKNNWIQFSLFITGIQERLARSVWRTAYRLETARQDYGNSGHLWRQAGCCIGLSFILAEG